MNVILNDLAVHVAGGQSSEQSNHIPLIGAFMAGAAVATVAVGAYACYEIQNLQDALDSMTISRDELESAVYQALGYMYVYPRLNW